MSLKPNPPRPGDLADRERYERDLADMKLRPWAWGVNPGQVEAEKAATETQPNNPGGAAEPKAGNEKGQAGPTVSTTPTDDPPKRKGRPPKSSKDTDPVSERNGNED